MKETVVRMQAAPASKADDSVRPITETDLPAIETLSKRIYKTSRRNEVASAAPYSFPAFLRESDGHVTGYLIPGLFGHGIAETEEDALALIGESARRLLPEVTSFLCPLREANLYRRVLKAGCRALKVANVMAMGPYEPPDEVWIPSVLY